MSKRNRAARRAEASRASTQPASTAAYEYRQLMSNMLFTDTSYQRPVDASRVDQIVENFDPRVANTLKVSSRDGRFYVFDGAHTLMALKKLHGDAPFPVECKVFFGLSYEDEAKPVRAAKRPYKGCPVWHPAACDASFEESGSRSFPGTHRKRGSYPFG